MRVFNQLDVEPAYSLGDAAFYLRLPRAKVSRWTDALRPEASAAAGGLSYKAISYVQLLELHVFKAMRLKHDVPFHRIQKALSFLRGHLPSPHPLLDREFSTNGLDLFFEKDGDLINASRSGQHVIRDLVTVFLSRIEWKAGGGSSFFPFIREETASEPRLIEMQPGVAFGRPVLAGTGIAAEIVAGRFSAWETTADLAAEYQVPLEMIEAAVRWEMPQAHAA